MKLNETKSSKKFNTYFRHFQFAAGYSCNALKRIFSMINFSFNHFDKNKVTEDLTKRSRQDSSV